MLYNCLAALVAWFTLLVSNFVYQLMQNVPNLDQAIERSFFQFIAVAMTIFMLWSCDRLKTK